MWTAILGVAAAALGLLTKLMGGGSDKADQRELGRAEQQNADSKADIATIRAANEAAKAEQEKPHAPDPHDRANRR